MVNFQAIYKHLPVKFDRMLVFSFMSGKGPEGCCSMLFKSNQSLMSSAFFVRKQLLNIGFQ